MTEVEEIPLKIGDRVSIDARSNGEASSKNERKKSAPSSSASSSSHHSATSNRNNEGRKGDALVAPSPAGIIAFLGETRFAKGEWAGIVLDAEFVATYGKNDGAVKGTR